MLSDQLEVYVDCDLDKYEIESRDAEDGYIATHNLEIDFRNGDDSIGVLSVNFVIIGFGIEGFDGGIETYFHIPYLSKGENEYFEEIEAFQFIFSNYGEQIQTVIDKATDILFDHYENGAPLIPIE